MNLWCYAEVVKCLTGNMGAKWEVKLHFCLLSGKTSQVNVWFIAWSSLNSLKIFLLTWIFLHSPRINVDVIYKYIGLKPVIIKYISENISKHINKNKEILFGNFDLKLVSFPGIFKQKIFQPSPLELLVPAVVRRHTQYRYRDMTSALRTAAFEV